MKYYDKKWYLGGCANEPDIDDKDYFELDDSVHDDIIISCIKKDNCLTITFDDTDVWCSYSKIVFYDYKILEDINLIGAWCIADELYTKDGFIEYHLLIYSNNIKDYNGLGYFTIKAKKAYFYKSDEDKNKNNNIPFVKGIFFESK